jgi:hypothetical protein
MGLITTYLEHWEIGLKMILGSPLFSCIVGKLNEAYTEIDI